MKNLTILVPAAIAGALVAATVFAASPTISTMPTPANAPNRAEIFAVASCGMPAVSVAANAQSWQNALANKRVVDRALVLVKASPDLATSCE